VIFRLHQPRRRAALLDHRIGVARAGGEDRVGEVDGFLPAALGQQEGQATVVFLGKTSGLRLKGATGLIGNRIASAFQRSITDAQCHLWIVKSRKRNRIALHG
jgi:hypothetical protein